jgi:hypothetical protein
MAIGLYTNCLLGRKVLVVDVFLLRDFTKACADQECEVVPRLIMPAAPNLHHRLLPFSFKVSRIRAAILCNYSDYFVLFLFKDVVTF